MKAKRVLECQKVISAVFGKRVSHYCPCKEAMRFFVSDCSRTIQNKMGGTSSAQRICYQ